MGATLNIAVIGAYGLSVDDENLKISQSCAKKMLAILAIHDGRAVARSSLSAFFWEGASESRARRNLRQLIYQLKTQLKGWQGLVVEHDSLRVDRDCTTTDIKRLMSNLDRGRVPSELLSAQGGSDYLFEWFGPVDGLLASWVELTKRDIYQRISDGLEKIMCAEDRQQSVYAAKALLNIDPVDETAVQFLLKHYASIGNVGQSLKIYQNLWQRLDEEFGMEPSARTSGLIASIKYGDGGLCVESVDQLWDWGISWPISKKITVDILANEVLGDEGEISFLGMAFRGAILNSLIRFREFQVVDCRSTDSGAEYQLALRFIGRDGIASLYLTLTQALSGKVLWSECIDDLRQSWSRCQVEIAGGIAAACSQTLSQTHLYDTERRSARPGALEEWLIGQRYLFEFRPDKQELARLHFERSIAVDPQFSRGYSSLAQLLNSKHLACPGLLLERASLAQSKRYAIRAVALDPLDSLAQLCRAWSSCLLGEYDQAISGFEFALSCNESDPWTEISVALGLAFSGRVREAEKLAAMSIVRLWARTPVYWAYHCTIRFLFGDYAGAARAAENADGSILNIHGWHALALWRLGREEQSIDCWRMLTDRAKSSWAVQEVVGQSSIRNWFAMGFPLRDQKLKNALERTIDDVSRAYSRSNA